jgi:hypothetical protein
VFAHLIRLGANPAVPYASTVFVVVALWFQLSTGHFFNEDYAVYLQQAFNLAHHSTDMGIVYRFDPSMPLVAQSPLQYPPLLAMLYALPVSIAGFDLGLFKLLQLALLFAGLLVFCRAMLGWGYRPYEIALSLLVFGLAAEIHRSINNIGSDFPFLLFALLALLAIERFVKATDHAMLWGVVAGAAVFLAIDMRTLGVALVPTLLWADVAAHRRLRPALLAPFAVLGLLWSAQKLLLGDGQSYQFVFHYPFFPVITNAKVYYLSMVKPFEATILGRLAPIPVLLLFGIALAGVAEGIRHNRAIALFITLYTALLFALPDFHTGARYLIPQILVLGAVACRGAVVVKDQLFRRWQIDLRWLTPAVAGLALGLFVLSPRPSFGASLPYGVGTPAAREVFAFIQAKVPDDAIVVVSKFRSFHLFTGRRTIRYWLYDNPPPFDQWLRQNHVRYAVVKTSAHQGDYDYSDCPDHPLCGPAPAYAKAIFRNRDFTVFAIETR